MSLFITTHPLWWFALLCVGVLWLLAEFFFALTGARMAAVQEGILDPAQGAINDYANEMLRRAWPRVACALGMTVLGALLMLWGITA